MFCSTEQRHERTSPTINSHHTGHEVCSYNLFKMDVLFLLIARICCPFTTVSQAIYSPLKQASFITEVDIDYHAVHGIRTYIFI